VYDWPSRFGQNGVGEATTLPEIVVTTVDMVVMVMEEMVVVITLVDVVVIGALDTSFAPSTWEFCEASPTVLFM